MSVKRRHVDEALTTIVATRSARIARTADVNIVALRIVLALNRVMNGAVTVDWRRLSWLCVSPTRLIIGSARAPRSERLNMWAVQLWRVGAGCGQRRGRAVSV
jgi:hypothetical protein